MKEHFNMNTQRTKLVHCGAVTYVYNYVSPKNIMTFSFEDEAEQLQRVLLMNFAEDYIGASFTLHINQEEDVSALEQQLNAFISKIARHGIQYIAALDLNPVQSCVHLLTNRSNKRTNEQLTALWGNTVTKDRISFETLLTRYATAICNTGSINSPTIFTVEQLKKPLILHNDAADNFLYNSAKICTDFFNVYELFDKQYGTVTVTEYKSFFSY